MKLFLKEHIFLIVVQIIQLTTVVGIVWLAGFRQVEIILYSLFLGGFFLVCYLIYYYIRRRNFYKRLSVPVRTLDETLQEQDDVAIGKALNQLLKAQYNLFQEQFIVMGKKQEEHLIFMDRWIHQMKTPLSVIELMAKDLDEPDASSFREETDRLKAGLNMVLYMGRLRTIEQDFHIKKVDLLKLIQEVNQDNKRLYIRNNLYPEVNEKQTNIMVESDEKWLFFMVSQLVQNAVKYSTGKSNKIQFVLDEQDGNVVLEVRDFGVGIPKEDVRRIFDAFYTGENGRQYRESTGMGLFLVKEVAEYLGHKIEVTSTVGEGSTFCIIFN
ncbi:sensor histidine kinase [Pseudogracilibacillus sp. SO30301A]|uniref:sensor histidine kinase n=1 Tax=Pseudogracilibacillus sp. SO30301A TaxID=3098291 RepID=UPI00300DE5F3